MGQAASAPKFPAWAKWVALIWILIWFPAYWREWGPRNFLYLCDTAVFLTCAGIWLDSPLLISSQAIGSLPTDAVWALDALWRLVLGRHLFGGTEYLFDPSHALWVRLLSLFHVALPVVLIWAVWRIGYDRRAWALQSGIALAVIIACRFTPPALNMNFAFTDPFFHRAWWPPVGQVAVTVIFLAFIVYRPTDWVLRRVFAPGATSAPSASPRFSARAR